MTVDLQQLERGLSEIRRELKMRESVYPKLIESGKLKRTYAERQYRALRDAAKVLEAVKEQAARANA